MQTDADIDSLFPEALLKWAARSEKKLKRLRNRVEDLDLLLGEVERFLTNVGCVALGFALIAVGTLIGVGVVTFFLHR